MVKTFETVFTRFDTIHGNTNVKDRQTPHDGTGHACSSRATNTISAKVMPIQTAGTISRMSKVIVYGC